MDRRQRLALLIDTLRPTGGAVGIARRARLVHGVDLDSRAIEAFLGGDDARLSATQLGVVARTVGMPPEFFEDSPLADRLVAELSLLLAMRRADVRVYPCRRGPACESTPESITAVTRTVSALPLQRID